MRALVYYVAVTLDGFIAAPDGRADFFPWAADMMEYCNERFPETVPTAFRGPAGLENVPNRRFGTVLMGRGTYEAGLATGAASPYAHLRQYVVSSRLGGAASDEVTVVGEDPVAFVRHLKRESDRDIWLCGGGRLAGTLLDEIDELVVKRYPIVLGAGVPMVDGPFGPRSFTPREARSFGNGATLTTSVAG
ncbi:dihydrofolate reductase family protein [Actinomadura kijaniata]|uniref:dihydrofolate reductase family protein n=1 Tax=Actinomadura kijaniata TaxID=46161 RepID=UPI00082A6512|nr:dihydrofolate reductase family protein [Actinomadura kijaniata]